MLAEFNAGDSIVEYNSDPEEFFFLLKGNAIWYAQAKYLCFYVRQSPSWRLTGS